MNEGSTTPASRRVRRPGTNGAGLQKDHIRLAAVHLFTRQGFAGTSMKQLARTLNTVPANLYNYYANKEAILLDVLEHQLLATLEHDREILTGEGTPTDKLRRLVHDLVVRDLDDPLAAFVGIQGLRGLSSDNVAHISGLMGEVRAGWISLIAQGAAADEFAVEDPKFVALSILTLCSSVSSWYRSGGEYTTEHVASGIAVMALRIVGIS